MKDYVDVLKNELDNVQKISDIEYKGDYQCSNGLLITIKVELEKHYPIRLAKIYIENFEKVDLFIPHVEQSGLICYSTDLNYVVNKKAPEYILAYSVRKAKETLEEGINGDNTIDFREEFIAFWDKQKEKQYINYFCEQHKFIKPIELFKFNSQFVLCDNEQIEIVEKFFGEKYQRNNNIEAFYIPIRPKNKIIPPNPKKGLKKSELLSLIRKNVTGANKRKFDRLISKRRKKSVLIIIDIPIEEQNNNIVIGYKFAGIQNSLKQNVKKMIPVVARRFDQKYLIERTSGEHEFIELNVAIVGVGSVGSKLSEEIASLGVKNITLIDNDYLEPDNLYRHALGVNRLNKNREVISKVDALQDELMSKFPYSEVEVESMDVLDLIKKVPNYFEKFDYIFICVGDTMTSLELNEIYKKKEYNVFYSWIEPFGIGGHSLYINSKYKGCFQCLYTKNDLGNLGDNRASFVKPGQKFEKTLASCRAKFITYNSIAARECALNTAKHFHNVVKNIQTPNSLSSWTGDVRFFTEMGYEFSPRYENFDKSILHSDQFSYKGCSICGDDK